jgi:ClpP class serine protease
MIIIYDINIIIYVWGHIMKNILSIYQNWKKKRQERKQAEHEKLLEELAEMVDKRRMELLQREREVQS